MSATIEDLEVNDEVEYYFKAQDVSTVSSGVNSNDTLAEGYSFSRGDPNKVFVVEWRDMAYYTYGQLCTVQALFYDVTNEIEYKYDSNCRTVQLLVDRLHGPNSTEGCKHRTSSKASRSTPVLVTRPTTTNFRIATSSTSTHGNPSTRVWLKSPTPTPP